MASVETQISSFLKKYSPGIAAELRAARAILHSRFPRGCELVYDNYNALVFAFATSERASEAVLSIAGYPRWVTLFFLHGTKLEDPHHLLEGSGSQVRGIRLASAKQLEEPRIVALIEAAVRPRRSAFLAAPPLQTVIRSISAKQRPRRPTQKVSPPAARLRRGKSPKNSNKKGDA